ncbi:MAG: transcriptional activator FtrB [Syntrophorhabdus sp. PtaU1.Bin153]|nr:MAG: transcriptional activator FtrB [Syntrophorhabdus sp. PtaU1.Bin153]
MAITESELFKGVSQRFITRIANAAEELNYKANSIIFKRGEQAADFYVLAAGDVHLELGEIEEALAVNRSGEVFGWSALVAPYVYTATARCVKDTRVIKISRDLIEEVIQEHPAEGLAVLKNLTAIIAGRLRYAYQQLVPET